MLPTAKPVSLLFCVAGAGSGHDLYLQLLSELAQLFSSRVLREQLLGSAGCADRCNCLLTQWESRMPQVSVRQLYEDNARNCSWSGWQARRAPIIC